MKWNTHVKNVVSKVSRRIYIIRNLRRSDCSTDILHQAYVAFIRSVLLFAYPSFCNLSSYLRQELLSVEKRVYRIIGSDNANGERSDIFDIADRTCIKFFKRIESNKEHPLRLMFNELPETCTRSCSSLGPPRCKTKRFNDSFIKYCKSQYVLK